jgi:hypothetical protein
MKVGFFGLLLMIIREAGLKHSIAPRDKKQLEGFLAIVCFSPLIFYNLHYQTKMFGNGN